MRRLLRTLAIAAASFTTSAAYSASLEKQEAGVILNFMGCNPSRVVAVINGFGAMGMGAFSGNNVAFVIATCMRNGKPDTETRSFFYDDSLGWFFFEDNKEKGQMRVWTKTGYKQFDPPVVPPRQ